MRLARYLSQCGVAARRKAETLIVQGRVAIDGKIVESPATEVDPKRAQVTVDGKTIEQQSLVYMILNKPKGTLSAVSDARGRKTVIDLVPDDIPAQLKPVGRLDFYTEGVLLLTNDGGLAAELQSPASHVEKTYHVKVHGVVSDAHLKQLRKGVRLDDGYVTRSCQADRIKAKHETVSRHSWLVVTLTEGKYRQVHRMFDALGYRVLKLARVAYGGLTYHGLRVGESRRLTDQEVRHLKNLVS